MWYEMKRRFIDAAARVMWADAWGQQRENLIEMFRSGELSMDWEDQTAEEYVEARGWPRSMQGVELTDAAPPTPDYARLEAAILLGNLETMNYAGLAEIVRAAAQADLRRNCTISLADGKCYAGHDTVCAHHQDFADVTLSDDEIEEFASDIALQALGHGVSWFDDHAGITIYDLPLRVPPVEFTYEEGELS